MKVTRKSVLTGISRTEDIDIHELDLASYEMGEDIKTAMPHLSPEERAFILTGITREEWLNLVEPEPADEPPSLQQLPEHNKNRCELHRLVADACGYDSNSADVFDMADPALAARNVFDEHSTSNDRNYRHRGITFSNVQQEKTPPLNPPSPAVTSKESPTTQRPQPPSVAPPSRPRSQKLSSFPLRPRTNRDR